MTSISRPRALLLLAACFTALSGVPSFSLSPEWSRPYLKGQVPAAEFIAKDDTWITLYHEVLLTPLSSGGIRETHRTVMVPSAGTRKTLVLAIEYDPERQILVPPEVWTPGTFGYTSLNTVKESLDAPNLDRGTTSSERVLYATTKEVDSNQRVIATWQIEDRDDFPGVVLLAPYAEFPCAELRVTVETPESLPPLDLLLVQPLADGTFASTPGPVTLRNLPAYRRICHPGDSWEPGPLSGQPWIIGGYRTVLQAGWAGFVSRLAALFDKAVGEEPSQAVAAEASRLLAGTVTPRQKAARLSAFVQSIPFRDVAWGKGAYTPLPPEETLRTLSGDCKAKVVLLKALLARVGIPSCSVLCSLGQPYTYPPSYPIPSLFNHVVLALQIPGVEDAPGALTEGPGRGWLLFDPSQPSQALGLPPDGLEGTYALWLAPSGQPFTVHTKEPGFRRSSVFLRLSSISPQSAQFVLRTENGAFLDSLVRRSGFANKGGLLRDKCRSWLQAAAPGAEVKAASWTGPDNETGVPGRLEISGELTSPLQDLGEGLFALPAASAIVGRFLEVPLLGFRKDAPKQKETVPRPPECIAEPRFQSMGSLRTGEVALDLPEGWECVSAPSWNGKPEAPWLRVTTAGCTDWSIRAESSRGAFAPGSAPARLQDLNAVAALFRQPILLKRKA